MTLRLTHSLGTAGTVLSTDRRCISDQDFGGKSDRPAVEKILAANLIGRHWTVLLLKYEVLVRY